MPKRKMLIIEQNKKLGFVKDARGYAMPFWTVFIGFAVIPIMALSMDLGRYFFARGQIAGAADAAALAAAIEINHRVFEDTGTLHSTAQTWSQAQSTASENTAYLSQRGVHAFISGIDIQESNHMVHVTVSADLSPFFPSVVPRVIVSEVGSAQVGAFH
jgi:hypothetical protein